MNKPWVVLDANHLAHRVFHTTPGLRNDAGDPTGVLYGFLRSVRRLHDRFQPASWVFCFDGPRDKNRRRRIDPGYKASRDKKDAVLTADERAAKQLLFVQLRQLVNEVLPEIGFRNVFCIPGFEGDDLVAQFCRQADEEWKEVLAVGGDKDLYQIITERVTLLCPAKDRNGTDKFITHRSFFEEWGIEPGKWASVKALAGCKGDDVPGLDGVAELTAARWFRGEFAKIRPQTAKAVQEFVASERFKRNLRLVRLPLEGTPTLRIKQDRVSKESWHAAAKRLGFRSILELDRGA